MYKYLVITFPLQEAGSEEQLLVLVGGWPDSDTPQPYSAVSLRPCGLTLPPLPRSSMWDPVAELVQDRMLICNMDYDQYIVSAVVKDYKCWGLDLAATPLTWIPFPPPPIGEARGVK